MTPERQAHLYQSVAAAIAALFGAIGYAQTGSMWQSAVTVGLAFAGWPIVAVAVLWFIWHPVWLGERGWGIRLARMAPGVVFAVCDDVYFHDRPGPTSFWRALTIWPRVRLAELRAWRAHWRTRHERRARAERLHAERMERMREGDET